jgi:hypothetical protein
MIKQQKETIAFNKILININESETPLHLQTCIVMISLFMMQYDNPEREFALKELLDLRSVKLGYLVH